MTLDARPRWRRPFAPADPASLAVFRLAFGLLLFVELVGVIRTGEGQALYLDPSFRFPYFGFEWVQALPGGGGLTHLGVLVAAAAGIAVGAGYRVSCIVFTLGFGWMFLLEKARYLNHFYLVILVAFLLACVPAHNAGSVTSWRRGGPRAVPAWCILLLRAQLGLVYLYAGFAKLNGDWLRGAPLRSWLADRANVHVLGSLLETEACAYFFSYGGLLLDLLAWPLLMMDRTRRATFAVIVAFHLTNASLFSIGIFPWLMIPATTIFFAPDWPRRLPFVPAFGGRREETDAEPRRTTKRWILAAVSAWLVIQALVPLRHLLYPGSVSWTEEGHRFAWHMKLRGKGGDVVFRVTNPGTGETWLVNPEPRMTSRQYSKMVGRPDMILQYAHRLAREFEAREGARVEVRATARTSLNGRAHQDLVDPTIDLATRSLSLRGYDWIVPLRTPLWPQR